MDKFKDPPYKPLTLESPPTPYPLPHLHRPYGLIQTSESQDFYFLENFKKICPRVFNPYKHLGLFGRPKGIRNQGSRKNFSKHEDVRISRPLKVSDLHFILLKMKHLLRHIKFYGKEIEFIREEHLELIFDSLQAHYYQTGHFFDNFDKKTFK